MVELFVTIDTKEDAEPANVGIVAESNTAASFLIKADTLEQAKELPFMNL